MASDESLIEETRSGDNEAYAELWRRHSDAARRSAWQFRSLADPDDLVSEAYLRILGALKGGGGPRGAFRPYLMVTVRNLANRLSHAPRTEQVDDFDQIADSTAPSDPVVVALDRSLTVRAFRSLPERWQTVLWYSEVERMSPQEVAPLLGLSANSAAALAYRAREGLRKAWIQAHVNDDATSEGCRWLLERMGAYAQGTLPSRERRRADAHLADCARCIIVAEEIEDLGSRLALVLIPIMLGATAGGAYLAAHGTAATTAMAAEAAASPPTTLIATGTGTGISAGVWMVPAGVAVLAGVALAAWGVTTAGTPQDVPARGGHSAPSAPQAMPPAITGPALEPPAEEPPIERLPSPPSEPAPRLPAVRSPAALPPPATPPAGEPPAEEPPVPTDTEALAPVVTSGISDEQIERPSLAGTGEPGATIVLSDQDDLVVATVTADEDGQWSTGVLETLSAGTTELSVVQTDTVGNVSPPAVLGPFSFHPAIVSDTSGLQCLPSQTVAITLHGWSGEQLLYDLGDGESTEPGLDAGTFDQDGVLEFQLLCPDPSPPLLTLSFYYASTGPRPVPDGGEEIA